MIRTTLVGTELRHIIKYYVKFDGNGLFIFNIISKFLWTTLSIPRVGNNDDKGDASSYERPDMKGTDRHPRRPDEVRWERDYVTIKTGTHTYSLSFLQ